MLLVLAALLCCIGLPNAAAGQAKGYIPDPRGRGYWCPDPFVGGKADAGSGSPIDLTAPGKVFVASLDKHMDRLDDVLAGLATLGWPKAHMNVSHFSAVNAFDPTRKQEMLGYTDSHTRYLLQRDLYERCNSREIETLGAIGCSMTHRGIWEEMKVTGTPYAVVLEDDSLPDSNYAASAAAVTEALRESSVTADDIDLIVLGWRKERESPEPVGRGGRLLRLCGKWEATHAYLITQRGARRLAAEHDRVGVVSHVDYWMSEFNAMHPDFVVLRTDGEVFHASKPSILGHKFCWGCDARIWRVVAIGCIAWLGIVAGMAYLCCMQQPCRLPGGRACQVRLTLAKRAATSEQRRHVRGPAHDEDEEVGLTSARQRSGSSDTGEGR